MNISPIFGRYRKTRKEFLVKTYAVHLRSLLMACGLLYAAESFGLTCGPMPYGYDIGAQVRFFTLKDRQWDQKNHETLPAADPASFVKLVPPVLHVPEMGMCPYAVEYGMDKHAVYYRSQMIEGADPGSFMLAGWNYAKDRSAIYYKGKRLSIRVGEFRVLDRKPGYATDGEKFFLEDKVLDAPLPLKERGLPDMKAYAEAHWSLQPIRGRIAKDKNAVYFDGVLIPGADPQTLAPVSSWVFKDRHAVYGQGHKLAEVDPQTVRSSKYERYLIDRNGVYFITGKRLPHLDAESFEELHHGWVKDKNGVHYWGKPFDADPETFVQVPLPDRSRPTPTDAIGHAAHAPVFKDRYAVYNNDKKLPGIDPRTMRRSELGGYIIDDKRVYSLRTGTFVSDLDPQSFEELNWRWSKDKNGVYLFAKPVAVDLQSFTLVSESISKDNSAVYMDDRKIEGADPATFIQVARWVFKDRRFVYLNGRQVMQGVKPKTMRVSRSGLYLIDGEAVYQHGKRMPDRDAASFEDFGHAWSKDKNGVYFRDQAIAADPATFTQVQGLVFRDANAVFTGHLEANRWYGIDAPTVRLSKSGLYAIDKAVVYHQYHGLLFGPDPQSFEELDWRWSKDKNGVYFDNEPVGADPATFETVTSFSS
jgi:hypothetical protein